MRFLTRAGANRGPDVGSGELWALVLAAGESRRMGGRLKQLIEVAGQPMVRRAVRLALEAVPGRVVVVVGAGAEQVAAAVRDLGDRVVIVANPDFARGMSASLKVGVAALPEDVPGVMVLLADQPAVTPALLGRLRASWPGHPAAACRYADGGLGPPCILGREVWSEVEALKGDEGARRILRRLGPRVAVVDAAPEQLVDVDTPRDLGRFGSGAGTPKD